MSAQRSTVDTLDGIRNLSDRIAGERSLELENTSLGLRSLAPVAAPQSPSPASSQTTRSRRDIVSALLFWAGEKLVAMPISSPKPKQYMSYWPEFARNPNEAYGYNSTRLPRLSPTSSEISHMDEILAWLRFIPERPVARLVSLRILIHPVTQRNLNSWSACARIVGTDRQTAHRWFERGVSAIAFATLSTNISALATELCVFDE